MKTYTEEQLQEAYNRGLMDGRLNNIDYSITDGFKPIELPKPMKTAMQELIEYIELNIDDNDFIKHEVLEQADKLIEKEKEQIVDAANQKIFGDITFTGSDEVITKGENYYNQTYNQKK